MLILMGRRGRRGGILKIMVEVCEGDVCKYQLAGVHRYAHM